MCSRHTRTRGLVDQCVWLVTTVYAVRELYFKLLVVEIDLRVCLVHFAKTSKDVNRAFEVLNEVYLQKFLHRWVVNRETNLMMLINPYLINNYRMVTVASLLQIMD